jgi:hypothetical protein
MDLDILKVQTVNLSAILVSSMQINEVLQTIVLLLAIIYTIIKIYQRIK